MREILRVNMSDLTISREPLPEGGRATAVGR